MCTIAYQRDKWYTRTEKFAKNSNLWGKSVLLHNEGIMKRIRTKTEFYLINFPFIRIQIFFRTWQKTIHSAFLITLIFYLRAIVKQDHYMEHFLSWKQIPISDAPLLRIHRYVAAPESLRSKKAALDTPRVIVKQRNLSLFKKASKFWKNLSLSLWQKARKNCLSFSVNWQNSTRSLPCSGTTYCHKKRSSSNPWSRTLLSSPRRSLQDFWGFLLNWLENIE